MKIAVCVKISNGEINPFDECALECALSLGKEITVVCMGPLSCKERLCELTRFEGTSAVLLCDDAFAGSDTLATAYVLSLYLKKLNPDLILCGRQSVDGDTAQVGPCLSRLLNYSLITNVMEFSTEAVTTRLGNEKVVFPCLMTIERINKLRFFSIRSRVKTVTVLNALDLNADREKIGLNSSGTRVVKVFENKSGERHCKYIKQSELMPLLEVLKSSKKAEVKKEKSKKHLNRVYITDEAVRKSASEISESVILINETDPERIAEYIKANNAEYVLWKADLSGRRNAPVTAAILSAGLCADCTMLETDKEQLYMYRPARSGGVTAKILCTSKIKMATVRTESESKSIIVSGGRGIRGREEELIKFAKSINADIGASRGLVDENGLPYEYQIGLTGKTVSPKIYIAVGISGAVHHTCAIEGAEYIIAINPDRNARIFDYADYGIIEKF